LKKLRVACVLLFAATVTALWIATPSTPQPVGVIIDGVESNCVAYFHITSQTGVEFLLEDEQPKVQILSSRGWIDFPTHVGSGFSATVTDYVPLDYCISPVPVGVPWRVTASGRLSVPYPYPWWQEVHDKLAARLGFTSLYSLKVDDIISFVSEERGR
jgi:hypothetical protein